MNQYIESELLPQVAERLEYTRGTLSKLKKLQNKKLKEAFTDHLKETDYSAYVEWKSTKASYLGSTYIVDYLLPKYVNKPFKEVIYKCRSHILYTKCKSFKFWVDREIRDIMKRPMTSRYALYGLSPSLEGSYYIDMEGILRKIEDHPDYFRLPKKERIAYIDWRHPEYLVTNSRKCILKKNDEYYFVRDFTTEKYLYRTTKHGNQKKKLNPDFFEIPLTKHELKMYKLI